MGKRLKALAALMGALLTMARTEAQVLPGEIRDIDAELFERYTGTPIPNAEWLCATFVLDRTGGHPHLDFGRPASKVDPNKGTTKANGSFTFKFFASYVAGRYMIICSAPKFPTATAIAYIDVGVDGLVEMPSAFQAGVYTLATDLRHLDKIHYMVRQVYQRPLQITTELMFAFPMTKAKMLGASTEKGGVNDRMPNPPWILNLDPHMLGREFDAEFSAARHDEIDATSAKYNCQAAELILTDWHFHCSSVLNPRPRPRFAAESSQENGENMEPIEISDPQLSNGIRLRLRPKTNDEDGAETTALAAQTARTPKPAARGGDGIDARREGRTVIIRRPRLNSKQEPTGEIEELTVETADGGDPLVTRDEWKESGTRFAYELEVANGDNAGQAINVMWFNLDLKETGTELDPAPQGFRNGPFTISWNHLDASRGLMRGEKAGPLKFTSDLGPGYAELFTHGVRAVPRLPHLGSRNEKTVYEGDGELSPRKVNKVVGVIGPAIRDIESLWSNMALAATDQRLSSVKDLLLDMTGLSAGTIREKLRGMKASNEFQRKLFGAWLANLERIN